jgi:rod shape determining protein RodA
MNYRHSVIPDLFLTLPIIFLLSLGILVIFSSDTQLAIQQLIIALMGLVIYWLISLTDIETYEGYIQYLYWATVILLGIVFIVGIETRGSTRWIPIGSLHLQPSEFIKPVIILLLAKFWSNHQSNWLNIGKSFLWILPSLILIFKQPDLGTTLIIMAIWLLMLVGANTSLKKIIVMSVVSLLSIPIIWLLMKDYQKDRIASFLSPEKDPLGVGYNVIQSTIAVGSGQLMGRGLGRGTQSRLQFLPEFRTDFIFASIAEEFGFIGSFLVLILYGSLLIRCLKLISL